MVVAQIQAPRLQGLGHGHLHQKGEEYPATGLEVDIDPVPPPDPVMVQVAPLDLLPVHPGRALLLPVALGHDPVHPTGGGTGAEAGGANHEKVITGGRCITKSEP